MSDTKPHIQEAWGIPNRINTNTKPKQKPHIDIIFKLQKIKRKEKHLKEEKEYLSYREVKDKNYIQLIPRYHESKNKVGGDI